MYEALLALGIIAGFIAAVVGLIIWSVHREIKKEEAEQKEREAKREKWLSVEKLCSPRYCIWFTANGERRRSNGFDPIYKIRGDWKPLTYTSQEHAEETLAECYKRGWFEQSNGDTFPVHTVREANVGVLE